jgi:hypothetical protein
MWLFTVFETFESAYRSSTVLVCLYLANDDDKKKGPAKKLVLWIRDILVQIRIRINLQR